MHTLHMVIDLQYGSTGKGLIAGYLAKRGNYDTVVCSFAPNAGHTYCDGEIVVMTQQLPTGIISPTVKNVMIGPGALIDPNILLNELDRFAGHMEGKRLLIHPHAAIVYPEHANQEVRLGYTKIGSTAKGVGIAMIERIGRAPEGANVAKNCSVLADYVVPAWEYDRVLSRSEQCLIEGAQGFSLSMYHGFYPYTTSRDVTPWQIAGDCGLPFRWCSQIEIIGTLRTYPIRVNNRDGSSGPHYQDQRELSWDYFGIDPERTTVTKLPRRIFTFSDEQLRDALFHCGHYWKTRLFLNFANYCQDPDELATLVQRIETPASPNWNPPRVEWLGFGPDDKDIVIAKEWDGTWPV